MTRTVLDSELYALNAQIIQLGNLVDDALGKALEALETGDLAMSGLVIEADVVIDGLRAAIEEHTIRLLTLQQPLGGRDLRYLTSTLSIAGDLERTGDGAEGIAQIILRMTPLRMPNSADSVRGDDEGSSALNEASIMRGMLELGQQARRVLQGTIKAFETLDAKSARFIWEEDDVVDVCYHLVRHDLMNLMAAAHAIPVLKNDSFALQRATYLLWIAHKLERVADHSGNICERIVFIVEGETSIKRSEEA